VREPLRQPPVLAPQLGDAISLSLDRLPLRVDLDRLWRDSCHASMWTTSLQRSRDVPDPKEPPSSEIQAGGRPSGHIEDDDAEPEEQRREAAEVDNE